MPQDFDPFMKLESSLSKKSTKTSWTALTFQYYVARRTRSESTS